MGRQPICFISMLVLFCPRIADTPILSSPNDGRDTDSRCGSLCTPFESRRGTTPSDSQDCTLRKSRTHCYAQNFRRSSCPLFGSPLTATSVNCSEILSSPFRNRRTTLDSPTLSIGDPDTETKRHKLQISQRIKMMIREESLDLQVNDIVM